jgi:carbonic anhydrase
MDSKQGALWTVLVLGGVGLLSASCSDSDDRKGHEASEHAAPETHMPAAVEQEPAAEHESAVEHEAMESGGHAAHWSYTGEGAPFLWGDLKAEYGACGTGKHQSPIDISSVTITGLPAIEFHYQPTPLDIVNNGHSIQMNYAPGSYITVAGKQYDLLQFHFHSPSEHTIGGKAYDMVGHLVHKAADGQLGVIGVMFKAGASNDTIATLWSHMPEGAGVTNHVDDVMVNAADLLPKDFTYFNYSGSLTTPPCSEGVNWMVMATPNSVSPEQVKQFTDIFPLSTRPVQALNGRVVNLSN